MDHWQRILVYLSACLVVGLALVVFTHSFFELADATGSTGYIALFAFGFVYLNLGFAINRRFMLKSDRSHTLNYLMSFLIAAPTVLWIFTKDEGLGDSLLTFTATILFAVFLGAYFGIRRGRVKRADYLKKYFEENEDQLPDDLKRQHEDLSNN
jgi:uncharacterized membrane protein YfcA